MITKRNTLLSFLLIPFLWSVSAAVLPLLPELRQNYIDGLLYDLTLILRSIPSSPSRNSNVIIIGIDEESLSDQVVDLKTEINGKQKSLTLSQMPRSLMHPVWAKLSKNLLDPNGINAQRLGFDLFFVWQPAPFVGVNYE